MAQLRSPGTQLSRMQVVALRTGEHPYVARLQVAIVAARARSTHPTTHEIARYGDRHMAVASSDRDEYANRQCRSVEYAILRRIPRYMR